MTADRRGKRPATQWDVSIKADRGGSAQFFAGNAYQSFPAPPITALKALPDAPDVLVGRDQLVGELLGILEPGGPRAVLVAGLAGVGKSALALTVAQRALERGTPCPAAPAAYRDVLAQPARSGPFRACTPRLVG